MLYSKNNSKQLDLELFRNPTSEYRGAPFWAWNTNLKKEELLWQIEELKKMGFGGYHMHVRSGMNSRYLSEEFMDLISSCVEKGKKEDMLSWLYDEDRWPSGAAGGIVTKEPRFRQKYLLFTTERDESAVDPVTGYREGRPYLLATFDVSLTDAGELQSYKRINEGEVASGHTVFAYVKVPPTSGRYNNQTYVDTLDKQAIKKFIEVTYELYERKVGKDFEKSIPAIFTDEPQFFKVNHLNFAADMSGATLPWTTEFDPSFQELHGYSIVDKLPEVIWNLQNSEASRARYDYYDHLSRLFAEAFADQCGKWCDEHGIALTGHIMQEEHLLPSIAFTGEAMRHYRGFGIPGIDILCDRIELTTAKQTQSAVHQHGKEAMLSELYGVTGWDFDFKGHKFQGDWQAALGVTVRVPHLSWVSMKGSAKRDYPASIHYQSSWYKRYNYVEDHFARLNTALTRGTPDVKIALVHPVETQWLNQGPMDTCSNACDATERAFQNATSYLLSSQLDFDFLCESELPSIYKGCSEGKLNLGKMSYSAVVIPPVRTLRKTTVDALASLIDAGGIVLFTSSCPECVDGERSDYAKQLYEKAKRCDFTKLDIANSLESVRDVSLVDSSGGTPDNFVYNLRNDGDGKWLFIARSVKPGLTRYYDIYTDKGQTLIIKIKGHFKPTVYDTVSGEIREIPYEAKGGYTTLCYTLYASDSLLLRLDNSGEARLEPKCEKSKAPRRVIDFKERVGYTLSEPNVMVLDMARYSWDGTAYRELEEILRIDKKIRKEFSWPDASGRDCQPWAIEQEKIDTFVYLKFEFESEIDAPCKLAFEEAKEVIFNGTNVPVIKNGWFTDREIYTMELPDIKKGKNTLVVLTPISKRVSLENMFILGDFGVRVEGVIATVIKRNEKIAFGSVTDQGLPFYGAAITYDLPIRLEKRCDVRIVSSLFAGCVIGVKFDGEEKGSIAYAPYDLYIKDVDAGDHTVSLTLYASRINSFGALHNCTDPAWKGPAIYFSENTEWSYEYVLNKVGILKSPIIEIYE